MLIDAEVVSLIFTEVENRFKEVEVPKQQTYGKFK